MGAIKGIGIATVIVVVLIICVTDERLKEKINKILSKKFLKGRLAIKTLIVIGILLICAIYAGFCIKTIIRNIDFYTSDVSEQQEILDRTLDLAEKQIARYKEIMKMETSLENCKSPYIPDGFKHTEGEWNTGFIIEDDIGNQFVWIPCTNQENKENIPILEKKIFSSTGKSYIYCYEQEDYEEFLISSLKNGGFYISRYEIGNENEVPVSKADTKVWNNISWIDAKEKSENMYTNINSRLINGYAFDTAISFIYSNIDKYNVDKSTGTSGLKAYKNIFDIYDDISEWTSEEKYDLPLMRVSDSLNGESYFEERLSNDKTFSGQKLGFRTIIYK